jgi:branched-chain amino acid transport system substrate-binding protein
MRYGFLRVAAVCAAAALVVVACGSDDDSGSGSTDTTGAGGGGGSSEPVRLAFLWEIQGESEVGLDDFQNGAELAMEQINADGGIDGRPVEADRFKASPFDPQSTTNAILSAADSDPAVMVGLLVASQAGAAAPTVERTGIPVVVVAQPDSNLVFGGQASSEWMWTVQPYLPAVVTSMVDYLVEDEDLDQIGLMGTAEAFGQAGVNAAKAALEAHGLQPVAERLYQPDATDFTEVGIAMANAQAVVNWGYPNPLAAQISQFSQAYPNIHTYDGPSAAIVAGAKLAPPDALETLSSTLPCDAGDPQTQNLTDMVEAYTEAYGTPPTYSAISAYDAVLVAAAAIEEAGSTEPDAVNEALAEVQLEGACGEYRADDAHVMFHQASLIDYAGDSSSKVVTTFELPDTPVGG